MLAIGAIRDQVMKHSELKDAAEEILVKYIFPELNSGQALLRVRACLTYGIYADLEFKDSARINAMIHEGEDRPADDMEVEYDEHINQIIVGFFRNMLQD